MAMAAFKSTSRRSNSSSSSSSIKETKASPTSLTKNPNISNKPPPRRSRSVSAVPRSPHETSSSDFLNKRDNPLYWSNVSPPDKETQETFLLKPKSSDADNRRGRSVSRNMDAPIHRKEVGRSLSKVDTGRHRSVSRGPIARTQPSNSQSDVEGVSLLTKYENGTGLGRGSIVGRKSNSVQSSNSTLEQLPNLNRDNGVLGCSFSGAEQKSEQMKSFHEYDLRDEASSCIYETVRSEVRRAITDIQNDLGSAIRSNAAVIASTDVTDLPPDLVNPSAIELVLDIRREYASKLEQSHERATKLRADLAVEEHRGLELSRILREVLPDPKTLNLQKTRPGRKSSIERRKMAKRLTEEAIAYFDECVSLSTFDSSDISSQDDPPMSLVGNGAPIDDCVSFSEASMSFAANHWLNNCPNDKQEWGDTCCHGRSGITATSNSERQNPDEISVNNRGTKQDQRFQFSFARDQSKTLENWNHIGKYVKNFERDVENVNINSQILRSNCSDLDEYDFQASPSSLLVDTLVFRNKIESGTLLLCGRGFAYVI